MQGRDGGDFKIDPDISFCYQHDARIHKESRNTLQISLFNNDNSDVSYGIDQTTGIFMTLDTEAMTATLDQQLIDPSDTIYSASQGNTQLLDDGHIIMGYGSTGKIKEYNPDGSVAMTAQFGSADGEVFSYRAYRLPWVGRPKTPPSAFVCMDKASDETLVYMSWNGATEHQCWDVFAGNSSSDLSLAAQAEKTGFETMAKIPGQVSFIRAEARGDEISTGVSAVMEVEEEC